VLLMMLLLLLLLLLLIIVMLLPLPPAADDGEGAGAVEACDDACSSCGGAVWRETCVGALQLAAVSSASSRMFVACAARA